MGSLPFIPFEPGWWSFAKTFKADVERRFLEHYRQRNETNSE